MNAPRKTSDTFFQTLLAPLSGAEQLRLEKSRLEAFLAAVPGEYCGFAPNGAAVFSDGFTAMLDLKKIENITDIQNALSTSDAAAVEGQYSDLHEKGRPFTLIVRAANEKKIFRLSGTKGEALNSDDRFEILWLEDVTHAEKEKKSLEHSRDLAESEMKRLQSTLDNLPRMMWMRGPDQTMTWCNKAYAAAVKTTPSEAIARQKELAVTKGKGPSPKMLAKAALNEGAQQTTRAPAIINGQRRIIELSETPLPSSGQTLGIAHDITREDDLEKDIKRYVTANKELLEQLRTAIGIYGPDYKLEFFNAAFSQLWELEEHWLNTRPKLGEIMEKLREKRRLPEQADFRAFKESWMKMFTRLLDPHEDMLYLPDGTALRMLVIPNPMGGLMMTFEDVTSRLELESSYNTLIAVQKETLDNLAEGVAVYGGDGRLKLWNPSFAEMWGFTPEDLEAQPHVNDTTEKMQDYFASEDRSKLRTALISHALDRKIQEGRLSCNNDTLIDYATVPLPDGGVLISYSDVTDSARVERALRDKNAALEAAERLKLDFLANVSYQLRTPLNALMGFNEILDNEYFGPLTDKQKEYTGGIQEAGKRLMDLINDILDLSSIEAGYMELDHEEFEILPMISALYDLTQNWARQQKLTVEMNCPPSIGTITADQRRLKQVLLNLIRNAIHFTPEGGHISVSAEKDKDRIRFIVQDTGIGISKQEQGRVFEPFERAQNGDSQTVGQRGAGLGLTLVRNIVTLHGGAVDIESAEGKGTTVTITLPIDKAARQQKTENAA